MSWTLPLTRQHPHSSGSARQVSAKPWVKSLPCGQRNQSWKCEGAAQLPPTPQFTEFGWCLKYMPEKTGTNQALSVTGKKAPSLRLSRLTPDSILHYFSHDFSCTGINTGRDFSIRQGQNTGHSQAGGGWRKAGCSPFGFLGCIDLYCHQDLI